jgi:predicted HD superfamily hydrolase involved in NAD metabolism
MTSPLPPLWPQSADRLLDTLRKRLKTKRYHHTLGVLSTALSLARSHGLDPEPVAWAALLHDMCKAGKKDEIRKIALGFGETIPPEDADFPGLWHAWAAAGEARRRWSIESPELLDAIRYHSTGHPGMRELGWTLMLSDFLEPTRGLNGRGNLRTLAHRDLRAACAEMLQQKLCHMRGKSGDIHPRALETLEALGVAAETPPDQEV